MATDLKAKYADILLRPRITEKATFLTEANVHTFEVAPKATKTQVAEAIKVFYKVNPTKIRIVKNPASFNITVSVSQSYAQLCPFEKTPWRTFDFFDGVRAQPYNAPNFVLG